jgi:hypothetical protein
MLASMKPFQEQEKNLAKLYSIELVFDEKTEDMAEKVSKLAGDLMRNHAQ